MISSADIPFNLQIWLIASILPYLSILIWKRVSPGWITYDSWAFPAASLFSFCTASWHVSVLYVHLLPAGRFVRFYLLFLSLHPEAVLFCPIFVLYLSALLIFFSLKYCFSFQNFLFTGALIILFIILFILPCIILYSICPVLFMLPDSFIARSPDNRRRRYLLNDHWRNRRALLFVLFYILVTSVKINTHCQYCNCQTCS